MYICVLMTVIEIKSPNNQKWEEEEWIWASAGTALFPSILHTDAHRRTQTHRHTDRHRQTHRRTHTHTDTHIDTHTHRHTHRHRHTHTDTHTQRHTHTHRALKTRECVCLSKAVHLVCHKLFSLDSSD